MSTWGDENMQERSYFAIIPAFIMHDKELKPNEKLLYGIMASTCDLNRVCNENNYSFAKCLNVSERAVRDWILHLKELGYIDVNYTYIEGTKMIDKRYISLRYL